MNHWRTLLVGALSMVSASLGISVLIALVKVASDYVPTVEILFFQSLVGVILMAPVIAKVGWRSKYPWWQVYQGP